ncbi:MAG: flagellar hook-associated protein 3, partial [Lachnospiraceae bacterium]|nr:flagellar hook-associated protein 3 [Lachnospiraceae bacterium]
MDVTETALTNIKNIVTDMRTLCVNGATGTLTESDRNTILSQLKALQEQVYNEGNADYAGRTVFTGYRTDKTLTFTEKDQNTSYNISEPISADSIFEKRFYNKEITVPSDEGQIITGSDPAHPIYDPQTGVLKVDSMERTEYNVIRLAYDDINDVYGLNIKVWNETTNQYDTTAYTVPYGHVETNPPIEDILIFNTEEDWAAHLYNGNPEGKVVGDNKAVFIRETGEMVLGKNVASYLQTKNATINVDYTKTGFKNGELRPEYYFDCTQLTDETGAGVGGYDPASMTPAGVYNGTYSGNGIEFDKMDDQGKLVTYDINYTVAANQELTVNMEAGECIDHNIYQDMGDMIDAVEKSIEAHKKMDQLTAMKNMDKYAGDTYQGALTKWIELAQKEADYYDDNLSKLYSSELGNVDSYLEDINLSITKIGCRGDQLAMTKTRMNNQQQTVEELQSKNDDIDLSDIIIRYTAAYTAYQSSLTAAGKLGQQTLLNYI